MPVATELSIIDKFSPCLNQVNKLSVAFESAVEAFGLQFDIFDGSKDLYLLDFEIPRSFMS